MVDDCVRDVQAPVAHKLRPEAEIPILAIREEVLIEQAYLLKDGAPIQRGGGARREDESLPLELAAIPLAVPEAVGEPALAQGVPRPVEQASVVEVNQLAREETGLGMLCRRAHQRLEPAWVDLRVVVQERHEVRLRDHDPRVHCRAEAAVLGQAYHPDLREVLLYEPHRAV